MTIVNKIQYFMKWCMNLNKKTKNTLKFIFFLSLACLPLITITNILGLNVFLDSFEKPEYYLCLENNFLYGTETNAQYLVLIKSSYPGFNLERNDEIIYFGNNGDILFSKVFEVNSVDTKNKFYSVNSDNAFRGVIYEKQIIGKIVKTIDDNIWNLISIKFWDISIHNLNVISIISKN